MNVLDIETETRQKSLRERFQVAHDAYSYIKYSTDCSDVSDPVDIALKAVSILPHREIIALKTIMQLHCEPDQLCPDSCGDWLIAYAVVSDIVDSSAKDRRMWSLSLTETQKHRLEALASCPQPSPS